MPSLQVTMGPVPRCAVGEGGTSGSSQEEEPLPLPSEAPDCTHSSSGGGGKTAQEDAGPGPGGTAGRMLRPVQEDGDLMPTQQSSGLPGQPGTSLQGTEPSASSGVSEEREGLAVRSVRSMGASLQAPRYSPHYPPPPTLVLRKGGSPGPIPSASLEGFCSPTLSQGCSRDDSLLQAGHLTAHAVHLPLPAYVQQLCDGELQGIRWATHWARTPHSPPPRVFVKLPKHRIVRLLVFV